MIVAFSTSSPVASVALIDEGRVVASGAMETDRQASHACAQLLEGMAVDWSRVTGCVADLGPGSFSGVRVGVTMAKTLAFSLGVRVAGLPAFRLIRAEKVAIPARKGEWFIWTASGVTRETFRGDAVGYGGEGKAVYPLASKFAGLESELVWVEPEVLVPEYLLPPSISVPKKPLGGTFAP